MATAEQAAADRAGGQDDVDFFVIGGGSGGVRAARRAAALGARVALAEARQLGGTCVNVGCIPKKLLVTAAHFHEDFADAAGYGWTLPPATFDWPALIAAKDREIARLNAAYARLLADAGVQVLQGRATVAGPDTVRVGGRTIRARHILVATGGAPTRPMVLGAQLGFTSDEAFHLPALPRRVLVFGAGYIAVEFASIFRGLGAETTLVYRGERLLKDFDHDLGGHLATAFTTRGIRLLPCRTVAQLERDGDALRVTLSDGDRLTVDGVMFATGRLPATRDLGLEAAGVRLSPRGAVRVDADFATDVPSIHAVGDVIDRVLLTPMALAEGELVAERLFGGGGRGVNRALVPTALFALPNIGTVGWSEQAARAAGRAVRLYRSTFLPLRHRLSGRAEPVLMKLVVDAADDRVLGLHMVGPDAGEIVQGFAVALNCGATKAQLDATLGIHPTVAEEFVTMRTVVAETPD